jgi:hypothetical protein
MGLGRLNDNHKERLEPRIKLIKPRAFLLIVFSYRHHTGDRFRFTPCVLSTGWVTCPGTYWSCAHT